MFKKRITASARHPLGRRSRRAFVPPAAAGAASPRRSRPRATGAHRRLARRPPTSDQCGASWRFARARRGSDGESAPDRLPRIPSRLRRPARPRADRDPCLNNLQLSGATGGHRCGGRPQPQQQQQQPRRPQLPQQQRPRQKPPRGSLENVSRSPWGDALLDDGAGLRRTRSLAASAEGLFHSLDLEAARHRRSQLIPRARLVDRRKFEDSQAESVAYSKRTLQKKKLTEALSDNNFPKEYNITREHRLKKEYYSFVTKLEESIKQPDSLDSNFDNKTTINNVYRVSCEDIPGLSLPNYYPDSELTSNISIVDKSSSSSIENLHSNLTPKFASCDNINLNWNPSDQYESIPYDENIILKKSENHYAKPRTIRGPTPFQNFVKEKSPELKIIDKQEPKEQSLGYSEAENNCDEIRLNNENITKEVFIETVPAQRTNPPTSDDSKANTIGTTYSNIEANPLYEQVVEQLKGPASQEPENIKNTPTEVIGRLSPHSEIKTLIELNGNGGCVIEDSKQFKTVVAVDTIETSEEEKCNSYDSKENKSHSHNYLKEFLESQKGSKRPLQNFIAKKFSNLSRRNSKDSSNLSSNQFYSLPDITVGKSLAKCEKIDRKLRKCDKKSNFPKFRTQNSNENRFIVNIGKHFDISADCPIPIDFELKIAKIPKKNKKAPLCKSKSDEQLIEAVKNLKKTIHSTSTLNLNENYTYSTPEVIFVKTKSLDQLDKISDGKMNLEYEEKLGSMRKYWSKLLGDKPKIQIIEGNEKCKIVDLQTKVEDVKKKFEPSQEAEEPPPSKVQITKQLFEPPPVHEKTDKISPTLKETYEYFENSGNDNHHQRSSSRNSIEIKDKVDGFIDYKPEEHVKVKNDESSLNNRKPHKPLYKSQSICTPPEFDHVRYKVVKSDLFQKRIFAKCEKESQFDGLMQYLQDYSFQELLVDNNIVIIEPIRSKIPYSPCTNKKNIRNITPLLHKKENEQDCDGKAGLRRHFFYHPIRVNKEVIEDELPNPDTVRQVRQLFENGLKKSQSNENINNEKLMSVKDMDPDKDRCSASDSNSHPSNLSDFGSQENLYDSIDNAICCEYVSEDILEKIRECGTTVTYYGGRVVNQKFGQPVLTKSIMEEIRNNEGKCKECSNCRKNSKDDSNKETYHGVKFKLVKSNSCSSRLELVGTNNMKDARAKFIAKHKQLVQEGKRRNSYNTDRQKENSFENTEKIMTLHDKNAINENIKYQAQLSQPKIIGEEKKIQDNNMTKWDQVKNDKIYAKINFNEKKSKKIEYDYDYEKIKINKKFNNDMEFEPYEVA